MTGKIYTLPWNGSIEGAQEIRDSINEERLHELENEHGALLYAAFANIGADILEFPTEVKTEVPEEAENDAQSLVESIHGGNNEATAKALYKLVSACYDSLDLYEEQFGEENVQPLADHVAEVRKIWRRTNSV